MTPSEAGRGLSKLGASKGGIARAAKLSPERRAEIASIAGQARTLTMMPIWATTERAKLLRKYQNSREALEFILALSDADIDSIRPRWQRELQSPLAMNRSADVEVRGFAHNRLGKKRRIFQEKETSHGNSEP